MRELGIELMTVFGMPPVEHVTLAADLGCTHISTGLTALPWKLDRFPSWSLRDDAALRRETIAAMRDRGVTISLAEGFAVRPNQDAKDRAAELDLFAELGAEQASGICVEPDLARAFDQFSLLADMTAERGMGYALEFAPPHAINTLETTAAFVESLGKPNMRLVIDAMHFFRTGATIEALAAIDPARIGYFQLCDVPLVSTYPDYYSEACFERLIPGDGELPLAQLIAALPQDLPIGLETPMRTACEDGARLNELVARTVAAARALLGETTAQPA